MKKASTLISVIIAIVMLVAALGVGWWLLWVSDSR